jgi:hypothetical protein
VKGSFGSRLAALERKAGGTSCPACYRRQVAAQVQSRDALQVRPVNYDEAIKPLAPDGEWQEPEPERCPRCGRLIQVGDDPIAVVRVDYYRVIGVNLTDAEYADEDWALPPDLDTSSESDDDCPAVSFDDFSPAGRYTGDGQDPEPPSVPGGWGTGLLAGRP